MDVFGSRLKQARQAARLSLRALAERAGVSQTAVQKYELGKISPASDVLMRLSAALGLPVEHLFRPYSVALAKVRFRRLAPFGEKVYRAIEQQVMDQLERRLELEALCPSPALSFDRSTLPPILGDVEEFAEAVRSAWGLGSAPIHHLIDLCERNGVRVMVVEEEQFDGLFGLAGDLPILVISRSWPGDRQRFTLAHELGHLLGYDEEALCNRFAGALLFPREAVVDWFGAHRSVVEWKELLLAKGEYGISMGAISHRLRELGVVSGALYRDLVAEFRRRGWQEREPDPQLPAERASLFEQRVFHALGEGWMGESKAAELLGVALCDLRSIDAE